MVPWVDAGVLPEQGCLLSGKLQALHSLWHFLAGLGVEAFIVKLQNGQHRITVVISTTHEYNL